jgi:hypothetical protein
MASLRGYRVGDNYTLTPGEEGGRPVTVVLNSGTEFRISGSKQILLYRPHEPYGQTLGAALSLGWCRVVDLEGPP